MEIFWHITHECGYALGDKPVLESRVSSWLVVDRYSVLLVQNSGVLKTENFADRITSLDFARFSALTCRIKVSTSA